MTSSSLRKTPVVTCFLMRTDGNEPRILLVRRSQRVGSYHAHWAGVSGFVEEGVPPDEQAYTEIREETGLQRDQVRMLRRGQVIDYADASIDRHWFIHPYLFHVLTPDAVKLDWEATEMRWISPDDLSQYETVPRLADAYQSAIHGEEVQQ
ncbi:MAG TPA: NUDIX pyrophosphatase [Ktedonobacteraceae bacterium]|jgi:ADP-ribose pyrophosphatase YjhB (NUDIX family)|nr:NUDIX pyrophosphatase [Ktedonobacteraceae bacterium]